jgi:hypothetical protein
MPHGGPHDSSQGFPLFACSSLRQSMAGPPPIFAGRYSTLAPLSSHEIKAELALAKTQWLYFEQALAASGNAPGNVRNAATTNERLLEVMDNLAALYGKALRAVVGQERHAGAAS